MSTKNPIDVHGESLVLRNVNAFVERFHVVNAHLATTHALVFGLIQTPAGGTEYRPGPTFVSPESLLARRLFIRKPNTRKPVYVEISPDGVLAEHGIVPLASIKPIASGSNGNGSHAIPGGEPRVITL